MNRSADDEFERSLAAALGSVLGSSALPADELAACGDAIWKRHPPGVRLRSDIAPASLPFPVRQVPWYSLGYQSTDGDIRPSQTMHYAGGDFFLQDAGSMLALAACDADHPDDSNRRVCDLCAAPGGKASALLESIGRGFLVANEPIRSRVAPLAFNLARTGIDRYCVTNMDPDALAKRLGGVFDLVLADVPCSGQALLGRGKQTLAAVSQTQVEHSASRAKRILASAISLLRPGGTLVLSTCTFAEAENEAQVRWLLSDQDAEPLPLDRLSRYASDEVGCSYRLWPHRDGCAGSFAASLRSQRQSETIAPRGKKTKKREKVPAEVASLFGELPARFQVAGAVVWGWPDDAPTWVESIAACGPELAYRTGQTWKPSHEAALRRSWPTSILPSTDIDDEQALRFLRGEPIECDQSGWSIVKHRGRPLGLTKANRGIGKKPSSTGSPNPLVTLTPAAEVS